MILDKLFKEKDDNVFYILTKKMNNYTYEGFIYGPPEYWEQDEVLPIGYPNMWIFNNSLKGDIDSFWKESKEVSILSLSKTPDKKNLIQTIFEIEF